VREKHIDGRSVIESGFILPTQGFAALVPAGGGRAVHSTAGRCLADASIVVVAKAGFQLKVA
jgi:hypothetical protein